MQIIAPKWDLTRKLLEPTWFMVPYALVRSNAKREMPDSCVAPCHAIWIVFMSVSLTRVLTKLLPCP